MPIPDLTINIQNGGLGLQPQLNNNVAMIIGVCSGGVDNAINSFGGGNPQAISATLGTGPLVEQAALLSNAGLSVLTCKVHTTTGGSQGSVTHVGTGSSVMTLTGNALDSYDVIVKFTKSGTYNLGDSAFQVSLDNGATFGPEIALPIAATYTIPGTGINPVFASGTLVKGDTYSFAATGPVFGNTDLNTALTAVMADPRTWALLSVVGVPVDASAMQTFFGTIDSALSLAASNFRFARGIMSGPWGLNDAAMLAANQALVSDRLSIAADWCRMTSAVNGAQYKRSSSFVMTLRAMQILAGTDAARVKDGPIAGVQSLNRDEAATPGLDVGRYSTLRTIVGLPGFYITNFRFCSSPTSDYQFLQHGRVMDIGCSILRIKGIQYLNDTVIVDKATGFIKETEARRIENAINAGEQAALTQPGFASDVATLVTRNNNIISTNQMLVDVRIIPLGYLKQITTTIAFTNPALNPS